MTRLGCANFLFTLGCIVFIGFNAPWFVTVVAALAAVEWKFTTSDTKAGQDS